MYNTNVVCTYNTLDIFLETDNITEKEQEFIRDVIYRQELLNIFELEDYNETKLAEAIHELYEKIKECKKLKECMMKLASQFMNKDAEFGLTLLYSFDYMYYTHVCVSEFLETGKIMDKNMNILFILLENILLEKV